MKRTAGETTEATTRAIQQGDGNSADNDDDDGQPVHDQLPSVEEAKLGMVGGGRGVIPCYSVDSKWVWAAIVSTSILLLVSSILIPSYFMISKRIKNNQPLPPVEEPTLKSRRIEVVEYLANLHVSHIQDLNTPGTPQHEAALWIADNDELRMDVPPAINDPDPAMDIFDDHNPLVERYALAVLYYATGGPDWKRNLKFLEPTHICDWKETVDVIAPEITVDVGVQSCIEVPTEGGGVERYVDVLYLHSNLLEGEIPAEIGFLRHLQGLVISKNFGVKGKFSVGLRSLVRLKKLELQDCSLTGVLPDWIGELSSLTNLALANNIMGGGSTLPSSFFQLTDLELLSLDGYMPVGDIAPFAQLTNLVVFHAKDSSLSGELTVDMMKNWARMQELDISHNSVGGMLPVNLLEAPSFVSIDLDKNHFSGTLPDSVSNNYSELTFLSVFDNKLTGTVPSTISNLDSLVHLNLGKNMLDAALPSALGTMTSLRNLYTKNNSFQAGRLPTFLEQLTNLQELSMSENNLTGSIPRFISALTALRVLELDQNQLSGSIPEAIGQLEELDVLILNKNQLTGRLPYAMAMMDDLDLLLIDGNNITGSADIICNHYESIGLRFFASDCLGPDPEIECTCCNVCCDQQDGNTCTSVNWKSNLSPVWEHNDRLTRYQFDPELMTHGP